MQDDTENTQRDIPEIDNAMARELGRAMFVAEFEGPAEGEARQEAWNGVRKDYIVKARKVLRRLAVNGITVSKTDA